MRKTLLTATIVIATMAGCNKENNNNENENGNSSGKITMTTTSKSAEFYLAGSRTGTITIDWGDGTAIETHTLLEYENDNIFSWSITERESRYLFSRNYSIASSRTITITGENITHLYCYGVYWKNQRLTYLDVSKNSALIYLNCADNELKSLNVSKNTKLELLNCSHNLISSLDVSKNTALIFFTCTSNQLSSLDVNKNTKLEYLHCHNNLISSLDASKNPKLYYLYCGVNKLTVDALNALFGTLHSNDLGVKKTIYILDNPGAADCNKKIVTDKGWVVSD